MSNNQAVLDSLLAEVTESPDSFEANRNLSEHFFAAGDMEAGYPYLKAALELEPAYAAGHNQMGVYYFQHGRPEEAERSFMQALQSKFDLLDAHSNLASLYHETGRFARALSFYKEVLRARPDDAEVLSCMGNCMLATDAPDDAAVLFGEALRLAPGSLDAAVGLSNVLLEQGRPEEAIKALLELLEHNPDVPPAVHFTTGLLFEGQGQYRVAMTHLRDAVVADEQNEESFFHLGRCARFLNMGEEALSFLARAVKIAPDFSEAIFEMGQAYYDLNQVENAIMAFQECLHILAKKREQASQWGDATDDREDAPIYNAIGYCHRQLEEFDSARSAWEKSLSLNPDQPEVEQAIDDIPRPLHKPVSLTIDD